MGGGSLVGEGAAAIWRGPRRVRPKTAKKSATTAAIRATDQLSKVQLSTSALSARAHTCGRAILYSDDAAGQRESAAASTMVRVLASANSDDASSLREIVTLVWDAAASS